MLLFFSNQIFYRMKILAFAGSLRKESFNKKLIKIAIKGASEAGGSVTHIELNDYPLPLYNADIQSEKFPDAGRKLKELFWGHDALLIATPEYNSGVPGLLKNMIDWVSRPLDANEAHLSCFKGKIAALVSASVGPYGGIRAMAQLRSILQNIQCLVIPQTHQACNVAEGFKDESRIKQVGAALTQLGEKTG